MFFHRQGLAHYIQCCEECLSSMQRWQIGKSTDHMIANEKKITYLKDFGLNILPELQKHTQNILEHIEKDNTLKEMHEHIISKIIAPNLIKFQFDKNYEAYNNAIAQLYRKQKTVAETINRLCEHNWNEPTKWWQRDEGTAIYDQLHQLTLELKRIAQDSKTVAQYMRVVLKDSASYKHLLEEQITITEDFSKNMKSWLQAFEE